jgi:hypothetical protein
MSEVSYQAALGLRFPISAQGLTLHASILAEGSSSLLLKALSKANDFYGAH